MNIDLPLVLVLASLAGIVIWLYDLLVLGRKRQQTIETLKEQYPDWHRPGTVDSRMYKDTLPHLTRRHVVVRETRAFLPIILLVLIVRSFIVEPFQIPSTSMEPTLQVGDFILVNKYTYGLRLPVTNTLFLRNKEPQRGDIMVFFPPHDPRYFIKRVIGVPGDFIEYQGKTLYINGEKQSQTAVTRQLMDIEGRNMFHEKLGEHAYTIYTQPRAEGGDFAVTVREGHYFMMGDNRDNSSDSRFWGQVPEENIVGHAFAIWMHWKDWSSLPSFGRVGRIQ